MKNCTPLPDLSEFAAKGQVGNLRLPAKKAESNLKLVVFRLGKGQNGAIAAPLRVPHSKKLFVR